MLGRAAERERIAAVVAGASAGAGGALVVRGEAGIGKTALLAHAVRLARGPVRSRADGVPRGTRVLRGAGHADEAAQPFAFLDLLLRPVRYQVARLPEPRATALLAALDGDADGERDRFAVRRALLSLLCLLAAERPLLCLVDDARWLDPASTDALAFAARRIGGERIALLIAARDGDAALAHGLPELPLGGLGAGAARDLLRELPAAGPLPAVGPQSTERIIAEAAGNPLALRTLAAALGAEQRADGLNPHAFYDGTAPVAGPVPGEFRARLEGLPASVRTLLLVAAAGDDRDLVAMAQAAETLGLDHADLGHAERAGLLQVAGLELRFTHPLLRAVAYQAATTEERRAAHRALAGAAGPDGEERRAWHLAAAAAGPDEQVAARLQWVAERAGGRRGHTAHARAARLTPDRRVRARRLVTAARAAFDAGLSDDAERLADEAAALTADPGVAAAAARVGAGVAFERGLTRTACRTLIDGAALIGDRDPAELLLMLSEAVRCGWQAGDPRLLGDVEPVLRTLALGAVSLGRDSPLAPLPAALSAVVAALRTDPSGVGPVRALAAAANCPMPAELNHRLMTSAIGVAVTGPESAADSAAEFAARCRRDGLLGRLPYALHSLGHVQLHQGRHHAAETTLQEGLARAVETGRLHWANQCRALLAWISAVRGDEARCDAFSADAMTDVPEADVVEGNALAAAYTSWARALLDLGYGRTAEAFARFEALWPTVPCSAAIRRAPDHIEAAVRCGRPDAAARPLALLEAWNEHNPSPAVRAVTERCRALVTATGDAEQHYAEALRLHAETDQPYERARTELLYGQWLRRVRRRAKARTHLEAAEEAFQLLGAHPWTVAARTELEATGVPAASPPGPLAPVGGGLTHQELQIVRLAASGASNREIATRLFLSPRTVGNHLYRAFPKLGIKRRAELSRLGFG
ncbi:AAA family ATPase [Spirillospora sp. NBC_01491]|uniref:AAA family ATPase n=1 Tax=Spirillospora sp. NBC_01491 TaxID=2976007 RepID=UPI002E2FE662|nr:AAA family ATPase [Spirillospora sp. NBC_01491]